jgi:hypothetical protein
MDYQTVLVDHLWIQIYFETCFELIRFHKMIAEMVITGLLLPDS